MAEAAATLINIVLQRVRDPQGVAHSRAFVLSLLSDCQRFINARHNAVVGTATLSTEPRRLFYPVTALVPDAIRVRGVREAGRDLTEVPWTEFKHLSRAWSREVGDRFEQWATVGRDLLVLYPGRDVSASVTVVYTKLTAKLASEVDTVELSNELVPSLLELVEAILLVRGRTPAPVAAAVERMTARG